MNNREIDRFIAEKVMGWKLEQYFEDGCYITDEWRAKENKFVCDIENFKPSTNIQDAWIVVEKLREQNIFTDIRMTSNGKYEVSMYELYDQDFEWLAIGVSDRNVSLAICLAALKAVGVH